MQMSCALLCISLCVFTAHLSRIHGMTVAYPEKKGWTLNSAGYLLGPYAHRSLNVRHRATGKRDMWNENSGLPTSSYNDSYLLSLLGHLAYLRLKEMGMTEDFSGSLTSSHMKQ
ncbi:galanin peptides-like [Labeo rohita]|uniref:galanin peptides-like n=1 Tax=Labeo rohita TaxID=84645 RepID=UPI0021E276BF|nr:galanin peptides-like [Labeo rohita]XP_050981044.1 galanin peptides-like [Labeo rohita]